MTDLELPKQSKPNVSITHIERLYVRCYECHNENDEYYCTVSEAPYGLTEMLNGGIGRCRNCGKGYPIPERGTD